MWHPNKSWITGFDNFLILLLIDQAKKGLKCDKSFKRVAFSYITTTTNGRFNPDFISENVENHYMTSNLDTLRLKR